jgi:hypothetical protein
MIAVARAADASGLCNSMTSMSVRVPCLTLFVSMPASQLARRLPARTLRRCPRIGAQKVTPSHVLSSPSGRLAIGAAGNSFSDLTGLYRMARGAALDAHRQGWRMVGLAAMSNSSQPLVGVRVTWEWVRVRVMSSVSHLRDDTRSGRALDAVESAEPSTQDSTLRSRLKWRTAGSPLEAGSFGLPRSPETLRPVRQTFEPRTRPAAATHSRARSTRSSQTSRKLFSRFSLSGAAWRLFQRNPVFSQLRSSGWSIRPQYRVHPSTTVSLEAHGTDVSVATAGAAAVHPEVTARRSSKLAQVSTQLSVTSQCAVQ